MRRMRRIGRWMFNGLTVLSLVLCLATVCLWVRSHWRVDELVHVNADGSALACDSQHGTLVITSARAAPKDRGWQYSSGKDEGNPIDTSQLVYPFGWRAFAGRLGFAVDDNDLYLPDWLFCVLFLVMPALWLRLWRRDRRLDDGRCGKCGYDLTGNVSGVCPECGKPISIETGISQADSV